MVLYLVFFKLNNMGVTAYVSLIISIITGPMTIIIIVNHINMKYDSGVIISKVHTMLLTKMVSVTQAG